MVHDSSTKFTRRGLGLVSAALLIGVAGWWLIGALGRSPVRQHDVGSGESAALAVHQETGAVEGLEPVLESALSEGDVGARAEIAPSATLDVRVTTNKFASPGRRVTIRPAEASKQNPEGTEEAEEATTNRSGVVSFQLPPDRTYDVEVERADDAAPAMQTVELGAAGSKLSVRIELYSDVPSARIPVIVKSIPDGAPVAGARVGALRISDDSRTLIGRAAVTDENGRASLPWAVGYRYEVSARGHSPWEVAGPSTQDVPMEVTLVRHARIHGQLPHAVEAPSAEDTPPRIVLFQGGGRPSAGTRSEFVAELDQDGEHPLNSFSFSPKSGFDHIEPQARIDGKGRWEVTCIPFSREELTHTGVSVACHLQSGFRTIGRDLVLRAGDDLLVHDMFLGAPPLNAQCVDEEGRTSNISGEVCLNQPAVDTGSNQRSDQIDHYSGVDAKIAEGGKLRLPALPPGKWFLSKEMEGGVIEVVTSFHHQSATEIDIVVPGDLAD